MQTLLDDAVNHKITQGSIEADAVLVLPATMVGEWAWRTDHIWGMFQPDDAI